jgi:hypothetical protein
MKRIFAVIVTLSLVGVFSVVWAGGTPSTFKRNNWTALQLFPEGIEVGQHNRGDRLIVDEDGTPELYNSSGTKVWGVDGTGNDEGNPGSTDYTPTAVSAAGYTLTSANIRDYKVFYIDQSPSVSVGPPMSTGNAGIGVSAGVTVTLPVPDATIDKKDIYLIGTDSGGSQFVCYVPGGTVSGGTVVGQSANRTVGEANVTSCTPFLTMDGYYDVLHLRANYNSAVSYEVLDYYNR